MQTMNGRFLYGIATLKEQGIQTLMQALLQGGLI